MTNFCSTASSRMRSSLRDRLFASLDDGRHYTYGDVEAVSARFANVLVALGVEARRPGRGAGREEHRGADALSRHVRAGAVFLPLNTAYTPAEIEYFLGDAAAAVFVCDPAGRGAARRSPSKAGARLETLGVWRSPRRSAGTLADQGLAASTAFCHGRRAGRRSRGDPLHLGHHRPLQGRDADATTTSPRTRWPWSTTGASPATTCCCTPADLPHPWPLRRDQRRAARRRRR